MAHPSTDDGERRPPMLWPQRRPAEPCLIGGGLYAEPFAPLAYAPDELAHLAPETARARGDRFAREIGLDPGDPREALRRACAGAEIVVATPRHPPRVEITVGPPADAPLVAAMLREPEPLRLHWTDIAGFALLAALFVLAVASLLTADPAELARMARLTP